MPEQVTFQVDAMSELFRTISSCWELRWESRQLNPSAPSQSQRKEMHRVCDEWVIPRFRVFMIPCANMTLKSLVCLKYLMQMKTDYQMESSFILWFYIMSCSFQMNLIDNAGVQFSVILMSKSQSCSLLPAQLSRWCNVRAVRNQSGVMFRECDVTAHSPGRPCFCGSDSGSSEHLTHSRFMSNKLVPGQEDMNGDFVRSESLNLYTVPVWGAKKVFLRLP